MCKDMSSIQIKWQSTNIPIITTLPIWYGESIWNFVRLIDDPVKLQIMQFIRWIE